MVSEPECVPVRVKRLRGFPDREEVRRKRRMDYEAFEGLWHRELNYKRGARCPQIPGGDRARAVPKRKAAVLS